MKQFNTDIVTLGNYYEIPHIDGMVEDDPFAHHMDSEKVGVGIRILTKRESAMVNADDYDWSFTVAEGSDSDQWYDALEVLCPWIRHDGLRTAAMDLQRLIARGDISEAHADAIQDFLVKRVA